MTEKEGEREKGRRESGLFILRQNGFVLTLLCELEGGRKKRKVDRTMRRSNTRR